MLYRRTEDDYDQRIAIVVAAVFTIVVVVDVCKFEVDLKEFSVIIYLLFCVFILAIF